MMTTRSTAAALLWLSAALLAGGCEKEGPGGGTAEPTGPPQQADGDSHPPSLLTQNPPKPLGRQVTLIRLLETHTDTFDGPLWDGLEAENLPPFVAGGGKLYLDPAVADSLDGDLLSGRRVTLGDPAVPLARCEVLVVHAVAWTGGGRVHQRVRYYGLAGRELTIPLPATPAGRFAHDPATAALPFSKMLLEIRPLAEGHRQLKLLLREDGQASLTLGTTETLVPAGQSPVVATHSAELDVSEGPLSAGDVVPIEGEAGEPGGDADEVILPGVEHGRITFTGKLQLENQGPVTVLVGRPGGEVSP